MTRIFGRIFAVSLTILGASLVWTGPSAGQGPGQQRPDDRDPIKRVDPSQTGMAACAFRGVLMFGKVKVVDSFPDFKIQVVDAFPDLKVQKVKSFPDSCGKWQFVDTFPDFTVQIVESFPDFTVQYVDSFPGQP